MSTGTVKWFNAAKDFGFIAIGEGGKDTWRHFLIFVIAGIAMGVALLHPAAMFIMDYQGENRHLHWSALKMVFSIHHLPMTVFFGVLGAFIGVFYAILNMRLAGSEKRIKILEGILPICCVCKHIRNEAQSEPEPHEWIEVEDYISSNMDVNVSHTYCPKCYEQAIQDI